MPQLKVPGLLLNILLLSVLMTCNRPLYADEILVAVASNFSGVIKKLSDAFEAKTEHKVILSPGSTGKHYAQIINGAPFDVFFSADAERPLKLEVEGMTVPGSRFTYAIGKLVLWSPQQGYVDAEGRVLEQSDFRHLSIANPRHAPYGRAAEQVLRARGLWNGLKGKFVRGENISQAFRFVKSGNAELGFVAASQVNRPGQGIEGSMWDVPQALYTPVRQQAVLLRDSEATRAFLAYVKGHDALKIIRDYGYDTP